MTRDRRLSPGELVERVWTEPLLRRRAAALGGVAAFFAAGLIAVGLGEVVLAVGGVAVLVAVALSAAWAFSRVDARRVVGRVPWQQGWRRASTLLARTAATAERQSRQAARRTGALASTAAARAQRVPVPRPQQAVPEAEAEAPLPPASDELYGWPYAGSEQVAPRRADPRIDEERRRALELNARGAHLRRAGSPGDAVAAHLEALEIFRSLNDRHAEAQSLNSLALALAAAGETDAAVDRFEESLLILREGSDDPEQGKVIANLGMTLLRQGADGRGRELLGEALEKLPPDSPAAHKVEAQLRRAS